MKTKVCPCCDQPIKGIYCKGCRKIVLNPVEQEIKYFLNTRHPEFEADCSYHNDLPRTSTETKMRNGSFSKSARSAFGENHPTKLNGDTIKRKPVSGQSSAVKKIIIGVVIYLVISFGSIFGIFIGNIADVVENFEFGGRTRETVVASMEAEIAPEPWPDTPAETPLNDWELSDEEVLELGEACSGYGHFPVVYDSDISEVFKKCVEDSGFRIWEETVYSYNSQMEYASWYQTTHEYAIDTEEDYIGTINIDVDTATGQIHGFSVYNSDERNFYELVDVTLKFMQEAGVAAEALPSGESFYEEARWKNEDAQKEQGFVIVNGLEVSCYVPDEKTQDFFSMTIYAPGYLSVVE